MEEDGGRSGEAECKRDSSLLGWDQFYLINCYRNIYPGCSSSSSHDVFMCSGCVHRLGQWWREGEEKGWCSRVQGGNTRRVGSGVSGFEVFVVVRGQEGGVQDSEGGGSGGCWRSGITNRQLGSQHL